MPEPIAQHRLRATLVAALAKLLSVGATKDATYDYRVGTLQLGSFALTRSLSPRRP
jgi:hypothetical protein